MGVKNKGLVDPNRAKGVDVVKQFLPTERDAMEIYQTVKKDSKVASKNIRMLPDGTPDWSCMTTHQKMKVAQDFLTGVFLSPEVGVRFIQQAMEDPMAAAKLVTSIMPKELNIEVENKTGVIMVPMREESFDQWIGRVNNQAKTVRQEAQNWDDILDADAAAPNDGTDLVGGSE
jgi:hypothetical protein